MTSRKYLPIILCAAGSLFLAGCSVTAKSTPSAVSNQKETTEALRSVAGALGGQPVDDKKLKELVGEIRKDPQAQSAIQSVTGSLSGQNINIKYCPVDGKRYSGDLQVCPEHQVQLKKLDE